MTFPPEVVRASLIARRLGLCVTTAASTRVETWASLAVVGCTRYEVSDMGRVRNSATRRVLATHLNRKGYPQIAILTDGGRKHPYPVHFLVMAAHAGPRPPGMEICHGKAGKLVNWWPENLRYDTAEANRVDRWGRRSRLSRTVRAAVRAWRAGR